MRSCKWFPEVLFFIPLSSQSQAQEAQMTRENESDTEEICKPGKAKTSSWRAEVLRSEQERSD